MSAAPAKKEKGWGIDSKAVRIREAQDQQRVVKGDHNEPFRRPKVLQPSGRPEGSAAPASQPVAAPPSNPTAMSSDQVKNAICLYATLVDLYEHAGGKQNLLGPKGAAVMRSKTDDACCILLYSPISRKHEFYSDITINFGFNVMSELVASWKDANNKYYSFQFKKQEELVMFAKHIAQVKEYRLAQAAKNGGQRRVILQDLAVGQNDSKLVQDGDLVRVKYDVYRPADTYPHGLGLMLMSQKSEKFIVGYGDEGKIFEESLVAMRKKGSRYLVIPPECHQEDNLWFSLASGSTVCVEVTLTSLRKKEEIDDPSQYYRPRDKPRPIDSEPVPPPPHTPSSSSSSSSSSSFDSLPSLSSSSSASSSSASAPSLSFAPPPFGLPALSSPDETSPEDAALFGLAPPSGSFALPSLSSDPPSQPATQPATQPSTQPASQPPSHPASQPASQQSAEPTSSTPLPASASDGLVSLADLLAELSLSEYQSAFDNEGITTSDLLLLLDGDEKELVAIVPKLGPRRRLIARAKELRAGSNASASAAPSAAPTPAATPQHPDSEPRRLVSAIPLPGLGALLASASQSTPTPTPTLTLPPAPTPTLASPPVHATGQRQQAMAYDHDEELFPTSGFTQEDIDRAFARGREEGKKETLEKAREKIEEFKATARTKFAQQQSELTAQKTTNTTNMARAKELIDQLKAGQKEANDKLDEKNADLVLLKRELVKEKEKTRQYVAQVREGKEGEKVQTEKIVKALLDKLYQKMSGTFNANELYDGTQVVNVTKASIKSVLQLYLEKVKADEQQ